MTQELESLQLQIHELREKLNQLRQEMPSEPVENYSFESWEGPITLKELFGDREDLWIIHNMGVACRYCTMWADGFVGLARHLEARAPLVVCSPDDPAVQRTISSERGWNFRMVQDKDRTFTRDMGFWTEQDGFWPGVSAFHRNEDGSIVRVNRDVFGPGDDYCGAWPLFGLLRNGAQGFEPS